MIHADEMLKMNAAILETDNEESMWVNIKLHKKRTVQIGTIYRRPNLATENNENMLKIIREAKLSTAPYRIVVGSFNHAEIKWPVEKNWDYPQKPIFILLQSSVTASDTST